MNKRSVHVFIITWLILSQFGVAYGQCASPGKDGNNYHLNGFPNTYYRPSISSYNLLANSTTRIDLLPANISSTVCDPNIRPGDLVLIIQIQGARINTANNSDYGGGNGTGSGYYNDLNLLAGNYEYAVAIDGTNVSTGAGGTIMLARPVKNTYRYDMAIGSSGQFRYQVIKVPQFENMALISDIVVPAWNGISGGVIVLDVNKTCNINGYSIIADGKGFRGGGGVNYTGTPDFAASNIYRYSSTVTAHGSKGEGIAGTPRFTFNGTIVTDNGAEGYPDGSFGKGAPANAGGGSTDNKPAPSIYDNQLNTGGGGGGNGGDGGKGGWPWNNNPGIIDSTENGGRKGVRFSEGNFHRIIFGGGGGAGSANNAGMGNGFRSSGAAGGGCIIIRTRNIYGTGRLTVNGNSALSIPGPSAENSFTDASGGAGAGGSIIVYSSDSTGLAGIIASARGGKGGSNYFGQHGPGAGGGGGVIYSNGPFSSVNVSGGLNGQTGPGAGNNFSLDSLSLNYGSTPGQNGKLIISRDSIVVESCVVLAERNFKLKTVCENGMVRLSWVNPALPNNSTFSVEHSTDTRNWNVVNSIPVTNTITSYSYIHSQPEIGNNYYRIKAVNEDRTLYSSIIFCHQSAVKDVVIFKINNILHIDGYKWVKGIYELQLVNMDGKVLGFKEKIGVNSLVQSLTFTLPEFLPGGSYIVRLTGPDKFSISKIILW